MDWPLAVISYSQAAAGDVPAALVNIVAAVNLQPDDPFVLRTAGQLAAWLGQKPKDMKIPDYALDAMNEMAGNLTARKAFADAYAEAKAAYAELAVAEAQAATQTQPAADGANAADPAWGAIPLAESAAASGIDQAEAPASSADALGAPVVIVDASGAGAGVQPGTPWGEFAPGVVLAPLQGNVSYVESFSPAPPPAVYSETVVNVYNDYDYYYPVVYDDDCNWYPSQVVFLGHFRRHGLLVARCRHKDVIVDHARNVYVGDARNVFVHNADNVVIDRARRITAGEKHQLTASRTPRTLLADNRGTILASRIERVTDHRRGPDAGMFPNSGTGHRLGTVPNGATVRDFRGGPNPGTAPRFGTGPGTGTAQSPRVAANTSNASNPAGSARTALPPGTRLPGAAAVAGAQGVAGIHPPAGATDPTGAAGAPGLVGRDRFDAAARTRNPLLPDRARGTLPGNGAAPAAGMVAAGRLPTAPDPRNSRGTIVGPGIANGASAPLVLNPHENLSARAPNPFTARARGDTPAQPAITTPPAPSTVGRPTAANTAAAGAPASTRTAFANPAFAGEGRPGGRFGPPTDALPRRAAIENRPLSTRIGPATAAPPTAVAIAPIAPPPATVMTPQRRINADQIRPASRDGAPATRFEAIRAAPQPRVETPAQLRTGLSDARSGRTESVEARRIDSPRRPAPRVEAPAPVARPTFTPPPAPARVETRAAALQPRSSRPYDSRDNKDSGGHSAAGRRR